MSVSSNLGERLSFGNAGRPNLYTLRVCNSISFCSGKIGMLSCGVIPCKRCVLWTRAVEPANLPRICWKFFFFLIFLENKQQLGINRKTLLGTLRLADQVCQFQVIQHNGRNLKSLPNPYQSDFSLQEKANKESLISL